MLVGLAACQVASAVRSISAAGGASALQASATSGFPLARSLLRLAPGLPLGAPEARGDGARLAFVGEGDQGEPLRAPAEPEWLGTFSRWWSSVRGGSPRQTRTAVDARGVPSTVRLPEDWGHLFSRSDLRRVDATDRFHQAVVSGESYFDGLVRFEVRIMDPESPEAQKEIRMLRLLRLSGNVAASLASEEYADAIYVLSLSADECLRDYMIRRRLAGRWPLPLNESLPLLVDLLRGVSDLNSLGIVHSALTSDNVLLKGGRPLVTGFGWCDDSSSLAGRGPTDGAGGTFEVSTAMLASLPPETINGWPTGPSNNVWQVGILFASLCLDDIPMRSVVPAVAPDIPERVLWSPALGRRIQTIVKSNFSVWRDEGFQKLDDPDAQELLAGLLEPSVERRWDALGALEQALIVARRRGIPVPPSRSSLHIPLPSEGDWE